MAYYAKGEDRFIPRNLKLKVGPIRDPKHIEEIRKILTWELYRPFDIHHSVIPAKAEIH